MKEICAFVPFMAQLFCGGGDVTGAGADRDVLSGRLNFDLSITVVAVFVEGVITEHVLSA